MLRKCNIPLVVIDDVTLEIAHHVLTCSQESCLIRMIFAYKVQSILGIGIQSRNQV